MLLLLVLSQLSSAAAPLVTASLVRARIDGKTWLGVHYEIADGWHIYWKNPGQSGVATSATLGGVDANGPLFPGPERFVLPGGIVNNGYADETTLLFQIEEETGANVHVSTRWLVCRDECVPGSAELDVSLDRFPKKERRAVERSIALLPVFVNVRDFPIPAGGATSAEVFATVPFEASGGLATAGIWEGRVVLTLAPLDALASGSVVVRLAGPDELRYVQVFSHDGAPR